MLTHTIKQNIFRTNKVLLDLYIPNLVQSLSPCHSLFATGALNRRPPTGASAYGIPRKAWTGL